MAARGTHYTDFAGALREADRIMNEPLCPQDPDRSREGDGDAKEGGEMGGFFKGTFYLLGSVLLLAVLGVAGGGGYLAYTGQLAKFVPAIKCECKCGEGKASCDTSCCPGVGEKGGDTDAKFDLTPDKIAAALVNKSATADGLMWNFMPDQKIAVKILEAKVTGDTAFVAIQLSADAKIDPVPNPVPPPTEVSPPPAAKPADGGAGNKVPPAPGRVPIAPAEPQPTAASISGVARIQFDYVAGTWYLMGVESLSLKIAAK